MAKKPASNEKEVYRDSKTGRWTKKSNIKAHPAETETEHRPIKRTAKSKGKSR
jgi:hypothetical protein